MSLKGERFLDALEALCREHGVQIATTGYDWLYISDLAPGDDPIYCGKEIVDDETTDASPEGNGEG